ncbi:intraflagellar transport protein-like protein [Angomonas deanei]|nr:intraflagellar transport protein-like protein [Angomonas deanei]|eukprot:EPY26021.1 intraflagellar transport protein-like protein [Angomonas deanei]
MQDLLMARLAHDPDKKRAAETLRTILRKRREKEELTKQCSLSVEEEKQKLIQQVKATRSDIEVLERQVNDTRDTLQESRVRLSALDDEIKNYSGDNVRAFQELQQRDQEMQKFIDEYPTARRRSRARLRRPSRTFPTSLSRISQALQLSRQMPSDGNPSALQALQSEVDAKRSQLENDQITHERLEKELLERKKEFDNLGSVEAKINKESEEHRVRMAQQKEEMEQYGDLDRLKVDVDQLRKELTTQKSYLIRIRDNGKQQLNTLSSGYEGDLKRLQGNESYNALLAQEQKLRALWQSTFKIEDFVRLREKDTQYLTTKAACLRIVDDINLLLKNPAHLAASPGSTITFQV